MRPWDVTVNIEQLFPAGIYLFKVNNGNNVFNVNFENISHIA